MMASAADFDIETLVKGKVEEELKSISINRGGIETREMSKVTKEVATVLLPDIANIITVAVTTAVASAVREITREVMQSNKKIQRSCLVNKYDTDKLEQYMRRDNVRISGIQEDEDEEEVILETKVINVAAEIGVELEPRDISIAHRLGKPENGKNRPVIVRLCHRKKKSEIMRKKKVLKNKPKELFISEDLTPLRVSLLKMVKDHPGVEGATTVDGKILAWQKGKPRPVVLHTPDDLYKVGITLPDWKMLKLDHLVISTNN